MHTTIAQAVSPVTFNAVTSISIGRLIARIKAYTDNAIGFVNPTPDKIVNRMIAPAPGAAGVPTEAITANRPIKINCGRCTVYPATPAIKIVATTCINAVPSMLIVIPSGNMKDAISSDIPNSFSAVSIFIGRVAALEDVEKPNNATLAIFFAKIVGDSFVVTDTNNG